MMYIFFESQDNNNFLRIIGQQYSQLILFFFFQRQKQKSGYQDDTERMKKWVKNLEEEETGLEILEWKALEGDFFLEWAMKTTQEFQPRETGNSRS